MSDDTQSERTPGPDTSAEAVERLAARLATEARVYTHSEAAATLRALLAERDAARAERDKARGLVDAALKDSMMSFTHEPTGHRVFVHGDAQSIEIVLRLVIGDASAERRGAVAGLGVAAVLAADAAQAARADAPREFFECNKHRRLGAADALARLCDQIGEEIRRRG